MRWFLLWLLLLLLGGGRAEEVGESLVEEDVFEEDCEEVEELGCSSFVNCGDCVSHPGCVYCRDPEFLLQERCGTPDFFLLPNSSCSLFEDPQNEWQQVINQSLTSNYSSEGFVQITPQLVRIKMRVGQTEKIQFKVAHALNYPVDLYYLMDLSNSMSDDRENVVKLGGELAKAIEAITPDYQIGFGSFVDKEVMPYISLVQEDNCQKKNCPVPYSFQHQMSLKQNATEFEERVRAAPISGNIDNPEGGLDALMQVMVCGERVGWREEARRVIIYTTDQSFHSAGDGKLGGLTLPNDGRCHLNTTGFYDWSTVQDYPSLGHINYVAKEHSVNLVWAVTGEHLNLYKRLTQMISTSVAGQISSDSSNVVELVRAMYQKITTSIKIEDNSTSSVSVHYTSDCNGRKTEKKRRRCRNIPLGTPVTFTAHVTLKECSSPGPHFISIQPVGLGERLLVEVTPICECECSRPGGEGFRPAMASPECNYNGESVCGVCRCHDRPDMGDSYFGRSCECSGNHTNPLNPESTCRPPNSPPSAPVCSGRGSCECGRCTCHTPETVTGQFCQCDDTSCDRSPSGELCSGRGDCECGECKCAPGWSGPACDCKEDESNCVDPASGLICAGHGQCVCGACKCSDDGYSGPHCSVCPVCPDQCESLRHCVECKAWVDDCATKCLDEEEEQCTEECKNMLEEHKARCFLECSTVTWEYGEVVEEEVPKHWVNCTHRNASYCQYSFSYELETWGKDGPEKEDDKKAVCPVYYKPDYFGMIIGIAGGIVGVGMLTILLWKAFTTVTDRREFARFEEERQMMKWNSNANPIFRQATTTIQNPMYCKDS